MEEKEGKRKSKRNRKEIEMAKKKNAGKTENIEGMTHLHQTECPPRACFNCNIGAPH